MLQKTQSLKKKQKLKKKKQETKYKQPLSDSTQFQPSLLTQGSVVWKSQLIALCLSFLVVKQDQTGYCV